MYTYIIIIAICVLKNIITYVKYHIQHTCTLEIYILSIKIICMCKLTLSILLIIVVDIGFNGGKKKEHRTQIMLNTVILKSSKKELIIDC